jgi:phosphatidylglycerol---prolipoprotein diacylglyceryl transferase
LLLPVDNGDGAARSQEARRDESRQPAVYESHLMLVVMLAVLPVLPFPAINPILISIGPLAVRWYALAYIVGIVTGWRYAFALARRSPQGIKAQDIDDFLVWATLGVVLGGRLGYVLFYKPSEYFFHPLEIVEVWHGGMSFHGGCLGVIAAIFLFSYRRGIHPLAFGDIIAAVTPIGLFCGRIANFVNGELYGRPADVPWAMIFPADPLQVPRHPSQLYEAGLEGVVLFTVLAVAFPFLKHRRGATAGAFLAGYGIARIIGEFFREPDSFLGYLFFGATMGQLLSLPFLLAGLWLILRSKPIPARA